MPITIKQFYGLYYTVILNISSITMCSDSPKCRQLDGSLLFDTQKLAVGAITDRKMSRSVIRHSDRRIHTDCTNYYVSQ